MKALNLLVVEDNLDTQYLVCEMLRMLGHQAEGTDQPLAALALLGSKGFDILFSDISLPGMSGLDLARRAQQLQPKIQLILSSGHGSSLMRQSGLAYVALQKPYDLDQLQFALDSVAARLPKV